MQRLQIGVSAVHLSSKVTEVLAPAAFSVEVEFEKWCQAAGAIQDDEEFGANSCNIK